MDHIRAAINDGSPQALAGLTTAGAGQLRRDGGAGRGDRACSPAWRPRTRTRASRCTCIEVPTPEVGPGEALIAVMASADQLQHGLDVHLRAGVHVLLPEAVRPAHRSPRSTISLTTSWDPTWPAWCCGPGPASPAGMPATGWWRTACRWSWRIRRATTTRMMDPQQRIWGFETNFGGLAELALVKSNQLMPKPEHLTWEEAASPGLVNSTAYRQLVSHHGAGMKQGDVVLIWGASGGLGGYATQFALNGGAIPVCVVSSPDKAELCRRMGAELIIDRSAEGYRFWSDPHTQDPNEWKRFGARIRELTGGDDPDIVFEHPGRETFGASVYRGQAWRRSSFISRPCSRST